MRTVQTILVILLLMIPALGFAKLPEKLVKDFSTIDGYVVMQIDDEYLIDLDASKGLKEGDILSMVVSGKKIVHPVTNEVIGSLDSSKGFLRVTRLKIGYSYARLLSGSDPVKKGDPIRRFDQVPVLLKNSSPEFTAELKQALPHFEWLTAKNEGVKPQLIFEIVGNQLVSKAVGGPVLSQYDLAQMSQTGLPTPVAKPAFPTASATAVATVPIVAAPAKAPAISTVSETSEKVSSKPWFSPNMKGAARALTSGDFDADGKVEIAFALDSDLIIARNNAGTYQQLVRIEIGPGVNVLAVDSLDLNADGRDEIYLSGFAGEQMSSLVVEITESGYAKTITRIPWHLRKVDLPGEGPVLLGQQMDKEDDYFGPVFRVNRSGKKLKKGESFKLPNRVNLYGFAPFTDAAGKRLFAYLSEKDYLKVAGEDGEILWESPDYFGGSEIRIDKEEVLSDAGDGDSGDVTFIRPRVSVNAGGEIVVSRNEGPRAFSRYRSFKTSEVVSLAWNGYALNEIAKTERQSGYLADFSIADIDSDGNDEIITLVQFKQGGFMGNARSAIVAYELQ